MKKKKKMNKNNKKYYNGMNVSNDEIKLNRLKQINL